MLDKSAREIWEAALGELQLQVSRTNYKAWLANTVGLTYENSQFVVGVPGPFVMTYLETQRPLIEKTLVGLTGPEVKLAFVVNGNHKLPGVAIPPSLPNLNPNYTFASFIIGNSNRLAYASIMAVMENPGRLYNPLFIYSGPGLGKTHLLHAAGHFGVLNHSRILYLSAEQFTNEFIAAIQHHHTDDFRSKYRSADVLLIDDIHFISGKEQTEESFFHTFNDLHNASRQIIITSDRPPKAMPQLSERLRSRFEWGLITDIQSPDAGTRLSIVKSKAERMGLNLSADVLEFIAGQAKQNVRQLEGCLNRVLAYAKLVRTEPTLELAMLALKDVAEPCSTPPAVTTDLIIAAVAGNFRLAPDDLRGRKRDKDTALARQVAMYLIRQKLNLSHSQIGKELGGRDHATVIHSLDKICGQVESDASLKSHLADIEKSIAG